VRRNKLSFNINLPRVFGANFFLMLILITQVACNKSVDLGLDVQPEGDLLNLTYSDTSKVISFTKREDSIRTDIISLNLLGTFNDPLFGKTAASIYSQLVLSNANPDFGASPVIDSVALSLVYNTSYYGTLDAQTMKVYEVTDQLSKDSAYYSNRSLNKNSTDLAGAHVFTPAPADSVTVDGTKRKPLIRVLLSNTLGQTLLNNQNQMSSDAVFTAYFKGLYIQTSDNPAPDHGGILHLNLRDALSKLTLYYHNATQDSLKVDFLIGSNAVRFSHFDHDYSSAAAITSQLADTTLGQNFTYTQAASGLKTKIWFPNLMNITNDGPVAINKAELVVKLDPLSVSPYGPPTNLVLIGIDSVGNVYTLNDAYEGAVHYGGGYDATKKQYFFNITKHLQFVVDKKVKDYGFYLVTSGASIQASRAVIGGGSHSIYPMKLKLTFTKRN